jgi:5S rRNA maturation endonuclease (ribonuclease M5)
MATSRPEPWATELATMVRTMSVEVDAAIVEGRNDERGLRRAGFEKPVYRCAESDGLVAFASSIPEQQVVILTDFDPAGRKLNARLRELIPGRRIRVDWRRQVGKELTAHGRRDIESMNNLFTRAW